MSTTNTRKRHRRAIQTINEEDAENTPILTEAQLEALNDELPANGAARKVFAELQENLARLREEQQDLRAELTTRKKARTRSMRVAKQSKEDFDVGDAGRFFALNRWAFVPNLTWMSEDILSIPDDNPQLASHLVPKKRFVQDYIEVLPDTVKANYQDEDIRTMFSTDMGTIRSTKVHDVKLAAYKIFDAELAKYITSSRAPGNEIVCQHAQDLLGFQPRDPNDPKSQDMYSKKPPFMFAEGDGPQTERLFRVEILAKTLRVMLFGRSSLDGPSVSNNETYGKMWGVTTVTAPLIAFATTVVNYLLSPDREFTPRGKHSNMEYSSRYARYRKLAETLQSFSAGRETLKFWNNIVFAGYSVDNGGDAIEADDDEDLLQEIATAASADSTIGTLNEPEQPGEPEGSE
ncbi:hypothetical protein BD410DRAFT_832883 [Rickenella mellea]|uniref:Uncharacterized protein n=1 Tax=Rickenella mellea TaxID=50990 RepID=A0A4Y7PJC0_9AGAM|nr:hypothetical protein BD410DRAFT_832883 [Rickenella mellea]